MRSRIARTRFYSPPAHAQSAWWGGVRGGGTFLDPEIAPHPGSHCWAMFADPPHRKRGEGKERTSSFASEDLARTRFHCHLSPPGGRRRKPRRENDETRPPPRCGTMVLASAAGHAHMAGDGRALVATIDDKVVAFRLAADGLVDRGKEEIVGFGSAQRLAQIGRVFLAETHIERAGAGHPHAIAGLAEIVRERRNESEA